MAIQKRKTNWRHGKSYRKWRVRVIRKGRVCACCGSRKNRHAHHIKSAYYHVGLRYKTSNGIVLCRTCHYFLHCLIGNGYKSKVSEKELNELMEIRNHLAETKALISPPKPLE